ncbi:site-specific DNA-methyltransferase [Actinoallomurus sp. NBC_01490]|uniref:DNA-methyltransferase n=1 Tax=Actinoallomurus sp. NBC_01490 TaxID=2903557 RepID=UPI002E34E3C5|nr:site-specific DNA-methyltransferase [Actinoallomurus sp. NBC_01490]
MRDPYYRDTTATLYAADPRDFLAEMPDQTVDCIVTSPPPWTPPQHPGSDDDAQHGHEPTPTLYVAGLRRVLAEAHRVLTDEGTCWLVTSDCYATNTGWDGPPTGRHTRRAHHQAMSGLPAKSLIGLPWQIAFAAHDDGWIIRNAIVWHHPTTSQVTNEEPVTDRLTLGYELIFLLVKQKRYHFDLDPIRQPLRCPDVAANPSAIGGTHPAADCLDASARRPGNRHRSQRHGSGKYANAAGMCRRPGAAMPPTGHHHAAAHSNGMNTGDVWTLPARPFLNAIPIEVPLRCIAAGCRPGGTVLDMFAGIATTGLAARELNRPFIGIEHNSAMCGLARDRLSRDRDEPGGEQQ